MLASKTEEFEILRNELKELNDLVKSFSSPPANSWEVQGKRQRPVQRSLSNNQRNTYTQQPRQHQTDSRAQAQLQPQTGPVNYAESYSNQQLQSVPSRVHLNEKSQPQLQGSDTQTQMQPQSVQVYYMSPHSNQQLQSVQSGVQLTKDTQPMMETNQVKPQPGMQLSQGQPLPGMQPGQALQQPGIQDNQAQLQAGMQFEPVQPHPWMQFSQVKAQPGKQLRPSHNQGCSSANHRYNQGCSPTKLSRYINHSIYHHVET